MFRKIGMLGLALWGVSCCQVCEAAPLEPIVISKRVQENPTLFFKEIPGRSALNREMESFLRACGWFDVVNSDKAEYVLSAAEEGDKVRLDLTIGGAPVGSWRIPRRGDERTIAKHAVDAIIEKSFNALKVRSFCTSKIAFCAETSRGIRNIFTCDIDGGEVKQITAFRSLCVEPCWFPDGKSIGYSKYNRTGIDVLQTNIQPRMTRVLTRFAGINTGAAVSPDGRSLAVILSPDHKVDLYVVPMGGGKPRRLTNSIAVEASPCWSPNGSELAYVSDETGSPRIFISDRSGRNRRKLPTIGSDAVTPDWSSDGKIVYATRLNGVYTIAVYNPATGKNERVTTAPGSWESPAWAADNRQVVCKRSDGARSALYVIDTWTGRTRLLVSTPYNLSMPVWSPCKK